MDNNILYKIDEYLDDELNSSEFDSLFAAISSDKELQTHFSNRIKLKLYTSSSGTEMPENLSDKIIQSTVELRNVRTRSIKRTFVLSAAAILVFFISYFLFYKFNSYEAELSHYKRQIGENNRIIELLNSAYPAVEISAAADNQIIVKSN